MNPTTQPPAQDNLSDLKAAVAARRELGPELEDPILEAFLARVGQGIAAQTAATTGSHHVGPTHGRYESAIVVVCSLVLAIPLLGVAGETAGALGALFVMAAISFINLMYFTVGRRS